MFKYQVVAHSYYYPSSALFKTYEEAKIFYDSIKGSENEGCYVTICKIEESKGEEDKNPIIDWYLDYHGQD